MSAARTADVSWDQVEARWRHLRQLAAELRADAEELEHAADSWDEYIRIYGRD